MILKYGVSELLLEEIQKFTMKALAEIDALSLDVSKQKLLRDFAMSLMTRKT